MNMCKTNLGVAANCHYLHHIITEKGCFQGVIAAMVSPANSNALNCNSLKLLTSDKKNIHDFQIAWEAEIF